MSTPIDDPHPAEPPMSTSADTDRTVLRDLFIAQTQLVPPTDAPQEPGVTDTEAYRHGAWDVWRQLHRAQFRERPRAPRPMQLLVARELYRHTHATHGYPGAIALWGMLTHAEQDRARRLVLDLTRASEILPPERLATQREIP